MKSYQPIIVEYQFKASKIYSSSISLFSIAGCLNSNTWHIKDKLKGVGIDITIYGLHINLLCNLLYFYAQIKNESIVLEFLSGI